MARTRYMISDAAKQVDVEAHVLRYWEEELGIEISRNEMGHRYYTEEDIIRFREIREMKEKGFQLKAIKMVLLNEGVIPQEFAMVTVPKESMPNLQQDTADGDDNQRKSGKAKELFRSLMTEILTENNRQLVQVVNEEVGDRVLKQVDYLFREQEEREEERFKRFDEIVRCRQKKKRRLRRS